MGKKGGKGKKVSGAGPTAEDQATGEGQGTTEEAVDTDIAVEASAGDEPQAAAETAPVEESKIKMSAKKMKKLVEGKIKVDFDHALTDEEKSAKKKAKQKGGKEKKAKVKEPEKAEEVKEEEATVADEGEVTGEETGVPDEEKPKKAKKEKSAADVKKKKVKETAAPEDAGKKKKKKEGAADKDDKKKKKKGNKEEPPPGEPDEHKSIEVSGSKAVTLSKMVTVSKTGTASKTVAVPLKETKETAKPKKGKDKKKEDGAAGAEAPAKGKKGKGKRAKKETSDEQGDKKKPPASLLNIPSHSFLSTGVPSYAARSSSGSRLSNVHFIQGRTSTYSDISSSSSSSSEDVKKKKTKAAKAKRERKKVKEKIEIDVSAQDGVPGEVAEEKEEPKKIGKKKKKGKDADFGSPMTLRESVDTEVSPLLQSEVFSLLPEPGAKKPKKQKKPKKKKPGDKEQKRLEEEKKREAEEQAIREAEEERVRLIEERKMEIAREKREILEQQWRKEHLEDTAGVIEMVKAAGFDACMQDKIRDEWDLYLVCDGLPIPSKVPQMNTYLHLWDKEVERVTIEEAIHRTDEAYKLLCDLQILIDDPFDEDQRKQSDWKWIKSMFREHQKDNINFCTYRLLRNIDTNLARLDIPTAEIRVKEKNFSLCLWVLVQLPIATPNPRMPHRQRVHLFWPEMSMEVLFPTSLDTTGLALRALYVKYDHLSDTSATFNDPPLTGMLSLELWERTAALWYQKLRYKYDNRIIVSKRPIEVVQEDGTIVLVEPEPEPELGPDEMPPIVPYLKLEPSASKHALGLEDEAIEAVRKTLRVKVEEFTVNLRRNVILGGVYHLDLFKQPTQPQEMVSFEIFITTLILPCCIEEAPFFVEYKPPPAPEPGVRRQPEEIEEELIQQEREFDKLIFVTLTLPSHVLWMDVPFICQWDEESKNWTTKDVHDFKHIEEKGFVTFRTGKFGPFALATYRFPNLPYQGWEIRPEEDGTVTLQLTAAIVSIEFHINEHKICITQLQNAPGKAMDKHLNVYYKLPRLIQIMRESGADLFPAIDTFFYVEGTCEKYWPMEKILYYNLAMVAICFQFTWSRWNVTSDFRSIVFQMRLYRFHKPKQLNYSTCLVTPFKAVLIDCTEVSPTFSEEAVEGMKFYADLYHLVKGTSTMATKTRINEACPQMVNTLADLLMATRFLSFS